MTPDEFKKFIDGWAANTPTLQITRTEMGASKYSVPAVFAVFAVGRRKQGPKRVWLAINPALLSSHNVPVLSLQMETWLAVFARLNSIDPLVIAREVVDVREDTLFSTQAPEEYVFTTKETTMVTKKDFQTLAEEVSRIEPMEVRLVAMRAISAWALRANPHFNHEKFATACGIDMSRT